MTDDEKRKLINMVAAQSPIAAQMLAIAQQGSKDVYNILSDNGRKTLIINGLTILGSADKPRPDGGEDGA